MSGMEPPVTAEPVVLESWCMISPFFRVSSIPAQVTWSLVTLGTVDLHFILTWPSAFEYSSMLPTIRASDECGATGRVVWEFALLDCRLRANVILIKTMSLKPPVPLGGGLSKYPHRAWLGGVHFSGPPRFGPLGIFFLFFFWLNLGSAAPNYSRKPTMRSSKAPPKQKNRGKFYPTPATPSRT